MHNSHFITSTLLTNVNRVHQRPESQVSGHPLSSQELPQPAKVDSSGPYQQSFRFYEDIIPQEGVFFSHQGL